MERKYFPYVVFVINHAGRKAELGRIVSALPDERREMVRAFLLDEFVSELMAL